MHSENYILGPFQVEDRAHVEETLVVEQFFIDSIDGTMIDVGAHYGGSCEPFLEMGWRVHAFEPDPANRAILQSKLGKYELLNISEKAASDQSGQIVPFYASGESSGVSSLSAFTDTHQKSCDVTTTTLTDYVDASGITTVNFLKIDAEGHDLRVLQGFPWEKYKPSVIECEFEDSKSVPLGYTFFDMADFLVDQGYQVFVSEWYPVERYGIRHNWRGLKKYPCEPDTREAWGNILAFLKPPEEHQFSTLMRVTTGEPNKILQKIVRIVKRILPGSLVARLKRIAR